MYMKKLFAIAVISIFCFSCTVDESTVVIKEAELTTFILVRHAEKGNDDPRNPSLNEEGIQRAEKLLQMISPSKIDAVYSSPYKRTEQTVSDIAAKYGVEITEYNPSSTDFVASAMEKHAGKMILVSGHSNTTPSLANYLTSTEDFQQLDESEYDKVFIISLSEIGKASVVVLSY